MTAKTPHRDVSCFFQPNSSSKKRPKASPRNNENDRENLFIDSDVEEEPNSRKSKSRIAFDDPDLQDTPKWKGSKVATNQAKQRHQFDFGRDPLMVNTKRKMLSIIDPEGGRHKELEENVELTVRRTLTTLTHKKGRSKFLNPTISGANNFKTAGGSNMAKTMHKICNNDENSEINMEEEPSTAFRFKAQINGKPFTNSEQDQPLKRPVLTKTASGSFIPAHIKKFTETVLNSKPEEPKGLRAEPSLKNFDEHIISLIESEIMSVTSEISWGDVAGLEAAKKALYEIVVLPFKRPDVFTGIRAPPKGVLLFGPPGTGKTMIGRCVASQCKATFFNISASSLTSKWVGEGEKLVRALFAVARFKDPSVIFIDEIDSLLCTRSETEHESSRRIKTEFLVQLDGVATSADERLLVLGATNRPQELDEAARRRFAKRLYVPLPNEMARAQMVENLLKENIHFIGASEIEEIARVTKGYSGADMKNLCGEAAMGPIRDIVNDANNDIETVPMEDIRPISVADFRDACFVVRPTVMKQDLKAYHEWDKKFGCLPKNYIDDENEKD